MKILIAEDEQIVRDMLKDMLEKAGYGTDLAFDGAEAMEKVKNNFYDLMLLDIKMPKLDGYEVLRQTREIFPEMPIIFVTGKGVAQRVGESISKFKLNAFIEKPFTSKEVLGIIDKILKK